jgi:ubiquinone/menaquinone biosynthesis C-methylase UbiE
MSEQTIDLEAVKQVQQKTWSEGDFSMVAGLINPVGEALADAAEILPDERVLDVACGSGNTTIPAARYAWGNTVGLDYVPELLERGRERAAAERLDVEWVEGDAENLPFEDASFDVVLSSFGVMFAPDHQKAADEMLRVCKPGGRIGMANWTPEGFVGEFFKTVAQHAPPPPGVQSPILWGTEDHLGELFGNGISELRAERVTVKEVFRSPDHFIEYFRTYFGPTKVAFERVGEDGGEALESDLREMLGRWNTAGDRAMVVPAEYLLVIATRA